MSQPATNSINLLPLSGATPTILLLVHPARRRIHFLPPVFFLGKNVVVRESGDLPFENVERAFFGEGGNGGGEIYGDDPTVDSASVYVRTYACMEYKGIR